MTMITTMPPIAASPNDSDRPTGPRPQPSKSASRFDAARHGLRAESILLPGEDSAHVQKRFVNLHAELKPSGELAEVWVDQIAFQSIRLERCQKFDTSHYANRIRHAPEGFDDGRRTLVEDLADRVRFETSAARKLQAMPEGVEWLLEQWQIVREDLVRPEGFLWSTNHLERTRDLRGINASTIRQSREWVLTEMVRDFFGNESMVDTPKELDGPARIEWARLEMLKIFDAEIGRLEGLRGTFNLAELEAERSESRDRMLFDASKELTLARKYEAATLRAFSKAIQQFRAAEAAMIASMDVNASCEPNETSEELGSFGQAVEPESADSKPGPDRASNASKIRPVTLLEVAKLVEIASEVAFERSDRV